MSFKAVLGCCFKAVLGCYVQPATRANPGHIVIHLGTNGLCSSKQPEEIAERIIALTLSLKTDSCDICFKYHRKKWPIE